MVCFESKKHSQFQAKNTIQCLIDTHTNLATPRHSYKLTPLPYPPPPPHSPSPSQPTTRPTNNQSPISIPHNTHHTHHTPKQREKKKTRTTTYIVKCPLNLTLSLPSENADSAHPGGRTPSGLTFPSWTSLIEVMRWRRRISMNDISLYANYVVR